MSVTADATNHVQATWSSSIASTTMIDPPSLRRSTRSSTTLDLSSDAYIPSTPRKKPKSSPPPEPITPPPRPPITPQSSSKKLPQLALDRPHPAPSRWQEQYRLIERMRAGIIAPVDDM